MGIADDMKKLTEQIMGSYDLRVRALGELVTDVHKTLKDFASDRKKMGTGQAKSLADFVTGLVGDVGKMIGGFQKDRESMSEDLKKSLKKSAKDIETYVKGKLKEFADAHADMSEELKKDLAKYVTDIAGEVRRVVGGFKGEMKEAAAAWQDMAATLAKKRGIIPGVEGKVKAGTVEEMLAEKKPKKKAGRPKKKAGRPKKKAR